jgi:hypothetical protein
MSITSDELARAEHELVVGVTLSAYSTSAASAQRA